MNTLALYYRASNEDANLGESATIHNQRDLLQYYVKGRSEFADWNVLEFQDDGWSGTTFDRPGVQKMLQMAGAGIQCVIVKDFSRFGRNLIEVGDYLDRVFPFLGVRFIAVNENFDSKDSKGRTIGLDVSLKAMVYELYSRDLSHKISSVKEAQMQKGQYAGSWAFYGYQKSRTVKSRLIIDTKSASIVQRIFSLAGDGVTPTQIAVLLNNEGTLPPLSYRKEKYPEEHFPCVGATKHNIWTQKRISTILRDERYTGCLISKKKVRLDISTHKTKQLEHSKWIRAENALDAIVSMATYQMAQKVLQPKRIGNVYSRPAELFRGVVKCENCGRTLEKVTCKNAYFRCPGAKVTPGSPCACIRVDKAALEYIVLSALQLQIQFLLQAESISPGATAPSRAEIQKQLMRVQEHIEKCKAEQVILFERFADGKMDRQSYLDEKQVSVSRVDTLSADAKELTIRLQDLGQKAAIPAGKDLGKYAFAETLTREMLVEVVKEIRVSGTDTIQIIWNFKNEYTTEEVIYFLCRA